MHRTIEGEVLVRHLTRASTAPPKWMRIALGLAGIFTVGTMSLTNFQLDSDFKWLLLIPSVLWLIAMVFSTVTNGRDGEAN